MKTYKNFNLQSFHRKFREGLYSDGFKIIECCWDYEKIVINCGELAHSHSSVYPIVFYSLLHNYIYIYIGDL
jgi:hypothetical protein